MLVELGLDLHHGMAFGVADAWDISCHRKYTMGFL